MWKGASTSVRITTGLKKMNAYELFSYNVKYYRECARISQEELAWNTQLSTSFISKVERGLSYPNFKSIIKMAEVLGVPSFAFFVTAEEYAVMQESRRRIQEEVGV